MKKIRIIGALNIFQIIVLIAAIVVSVAVLPQIMIFKTKPAQKIFAITEVNGTETDVTNGYADVTMYGAVANDGKDDTNAFMDAVKTGASIYVPIGKFEINKTIKLKSQILKGAGISKTEIRYTGDNDIISASGAICIYDISLGFSENSVTGKETEGQCVAIRDNGMTYNSSFRSVSIDNVGTGFYSPKTKDSTMALNIEAMIFNRFSYKALEIKSAYSTVIRSTFVKEAKAGKTAAVSLGGAFTVESLAFEGTKANYILEFNKADSAIIKSLLFNNVSADSGSIIHSVSSMMSMQTVTAVNSSADFLIGIDDSSDGALSAGNLISFCTDNNKIAVDKSNVIKCDSIQG